MDVKWCCTSFKSAYDHAGERGFAILVEADDIVGPRFIWQHRAISRGRESEIQGPHDSIVIGNTGLVFCPWCGRDLRTFTDAMRKNSPGPALKSSSVEQLEYAESTMLS